MNTKHILPLATLATAVGFAACNDSQSKAISEPSTAEPPPGMIWIAGGTFAMGTDEATASTQPVRSGAEEMPQHNAIIEGFWMDETEVTNRQFKAFIDATGHVTQSEKPFSQDDYPEANPEDLEPASFAFKQPKEKIDVKSTSHWTWWQLVRNANWRQPEGPGSSIDDRMDHPVVCVSYADCAAYAKWAGKRLPTEAEWEFAARGGLKNKLYVWGSELQPGGKWLANIWQGDFPNENTGEDGYLVTSPVKSFPPNGYGLYDIAGNVWEIVADPYEKGYYARSPKYNPTGPENPPDMPGTKDIKQRIIRGGSFLCTEGYCTGYRPGARQLTDDISASNHTGFRCVKAIDR